MRTIGDIATEAALGSTPEWASLPSRSKKRGVVPSGLDQEADIDIPRRVQGAWKPTGGVRVLHRALTSAERAAVTMRAQDLEEALRPYAPDEREDVEIALFAMLGGFRSMRQQADNAEAVIQVLRNVLREDVWLHSLPG